MKNLLIIFTLFLGLGMADAQTKKAVAKAATKKEQPIASTKEQTPAEVKGPTKEETIEFIVNNIPTVPIGEELLLKLDHLVYHRMVESNYGAAREFDRMSAVN